MDKAIKKLEARAEVYYKQSELYKAKGFDMHDPFEAEIYFQKAKAIEEAIKIIKEQDAR